MKFDYVQLTIGKNKYKMPYSWYKNRKGSKRLHSINMKMSESAESLVAAALEDKKPTIDPRAFVEALTVCHEMNLNVLFEKISNWYIEYIDEGKTNTFGSFDPSKVDRGRLSESI